MSQTHLMALPSPLSNITQYSTLVESFPRLGEDEERSLAERLAETNDLSAAYTLITSHLRYVLYIARGYSGYGMPKEDLIQEGNIGLMQAVRRFDPSRGIRLAAYASYWIRAQIHDFIIRNWSQVKVTTTKAKRKLFYKLRSAKQRLEWLNQSEAEEIANTLGVDPDDVMDMETHLYRVNPSFDAPISQSGNELATYADVIESPGTTPESWTSECEFFDTASSALQDALTALDARSRDIVTSRWLAEDDDKPTLTALGERYGVSAERIRQLEATALNRLREMLVPRLGVDHCDVTLTEATEPDRSVVSRSVALGASVFRTSADDGEVLVGQSSKPQP